MQPAPVPKEVWNSLQSIASGPGKIALDWIIHNAAGTYDETFIPGHEDVSHYKQGKRSVGLQIVKAINLKSTYFDKKEN